MTKWRASCSRPVVGDDNPLYDKDPEDYDDEVLLEDEDLCLPWEQEEEEDLNEVKNEAALCATGSASPGCGSCATNV